MILSKEEIIIPTEKILNYLLVFKEKNDKSKFLASLGYTKENWKYLLNDIQYIATHNEIVLEKISEFGNLYSIKGYLKKSVVITIWFEQLNENYLDL